MFLVHSFKKSKEDIVQVRLGQTLNIKTEKWIKSIYSLDTTPEGLCLSASSSLCGNMANTCSWAQIIHPHTRRSDVHTHTHTHTHKHTHTDGRTPCRRTLIARLAESSYLHATVALLTTEDTLSTPPLLLLPLSTTHPPLSPCLFDFSLYLLRWIAGSVAPF